MSSIARASGRALFVTALICGAATLAWSHHAAAPVFDLNAEKTVAGVVKQVDWTNPHIWVWIDVANASGQVETWAQFNGVLGAPDNAAPPEWNFDAIRRQGDQFFVESLPPNDPLRSAAEQALKGGLLGLSMRDLTDDDIRAICDARAALNEAQLRVQLVSPPRPCPVKTLGAMSQSLQRSRDAILREHLQARSEELKQVQPNAQKFQLFIFGHTHEAQSPFEPMSGLSRWQPIVINTGAWQRVISPEALERWRGARPASVVLSALPEALPPCYSVVVVEPYQVSPKASLRYWTNRDGRWQFADSCRWTPPAK